MKPISELNLIKIGEIQKTRGYRGEVFIELYSEIIFNKETELIFPKIDGYWVPFFFSCKPKFLKHGIVAKFDSISNEKEASELIGCFVYTTPENISHPETDILDHVEGYRVFDTTVYIGKASGYLNIPSNPILEVIADDGNEILIPVNEEFLVEININEEKIIFKLPEGLIDINRS
jgi:16S rRNA processing protein RimM